MARAVRLKRALRVPYMYLRRSADSKSGLKVEIGAKTKILRGTVHSVPSYKKWCNFLTGCVS